jgi:uncharacterized protein (TIGR02246 family)
MTRIGFPGTIGSVRPPAGDRADRQTTHPVEGDPMTSSTATVTDTDVGAIKAIVRRLAESWAAGDADTLAGLYAEDATVVLPGNPPARGREAIRQFMAGALAGKWKDTHVLGVPLELKPIREDVVVLVSEGGAYQPGTSAVSDSDAIRGLWVFVKQDDEWTIAAYENTPVGQPIPLPA